MNFLGSSTKKTNTLRVYRFCNAKVTKIQQNMQDCQTFETVASQNYENNVKDNKIWIVFLCLTTFS